MGDDNIPAGRPESGDADQDTTQSSQQANPKTVQGDWRRLVTATNSLGNEPDAEKALAEILVQIRDLELNAVPGDMFAIASASTALEDIGESEYSDPFALAVAFRVSLALDCLLEFLLTGYPVEEAWPGAISEMIDMDALKSGLSVRSPLTVNQADLLIATAFDERKRRVNQQTSNPQASE